MSRQSSASRKSTRRPSYRKFAIFGALVGGLTLTTALLLAFSPAPLAPGAADSLFAVESPRSLDAVFATEVSTASHHWSSIYIHHSRTPGGDAVSLGRATGGMGDHFLIGNGEGCADGEIQLGQRWNHQQPAMPPAGVATIDPACISICLVGDFDRTAPTSTQMRRLILLVNTLQARFRIPADHVVALPDKAGAAGVGRFFPATVFRRQLLQ